MGNLTTAVESVEYERHASEDIIATAGSMQGFRLDMEDDLTICLRLPKHPNCAFVGVYDGHSGNFSSECLAQKLWREIDNLEKITEESISWIILQMDLDWSKSPHRFSGSTIVFAIIERPKTRNKTYKILIGWVGDSRAFAVKKGRLNDLTVDHKPNNPEEKARIESAGGSVSYDNRVDGELAMSRAFGDWNLKDLDNTNDEDYKKNKVICIPDYQSIELEEGDCLLLSCDGLTEQLENKDIYDELLEQRNRNPDDADVVIDGLLQKALQSGSKDNMTAVLVEFRDGTKFGERDITRVHTLRPGPLMEYNRSSNFFDAYIKNVKSMGLWDCPHLRKAGFLRDLKIAEEDSKVNESATDAVAKRNKYDDMKQQVEKAIKDLENQDFESRAEPLVAPYSAFGDTEFLLKPTREGYIAFLSDEKHSDEKKDDEERSIKL